MLTGILQRFGRRWRIVFLLWTESYNDLSSVWSHTSSATHLNNKEWMDMNMFQSGHRRYGQKKEMVILLLRDWRKTIGVM